MCEVVVLLIKPIVFLMFSLPSASLDLKVSNDEGGDYDYDDDHDDDDDGDDDNDDDDTDVMTMVMTVIKHSVFHCRLF